MAALIVTFPKGHGEQWKFEATSKMFLADHWSLSLVTNISGVKLSLLEHGSRSQVLNSV